MHRPNSVMMGGSECACEDGVYGMGQLELKINVEVDDEAFFQCRVSVRNPTKQTQILSNVSVVLPRIEGRVLEHGWQSWSVVRRTAPDDVRPERQATELWRKRCLLAAPEFAGKAVVGEPFLLHEGGLIGVLDGAVNFGTVAVDPQRTIVELLVGGTAVAPGAELVLDPLWIKSGDPTRVVEEFADAWGKQNAARNRTRSPLGWCSWYQYFTAVKPTDIEANQRACRQLGVEVIQIDDGYQRAVGDWLDPAPGWGGKLADLASSIRADGFVAGIWTAPFLASEHSRVVAEHPEWLLREEDGRPLRAMYNPGSWGGWAVGLDPRNDDFIDHLQNTYRHLVELGFTYHKIDFCYAGALGGVGTPMTGAQALRRGIGAIREAIGADAFLLGCGCPFGAAIGLVDAMRVSADTAPRWSVPEIWAEDPKERGFVEHFPSARNSVEASVLRTPLHRRLWINDPDCLMLRSFDTQLSEVERQLLGAVIAGTGGLVILSDDTTRYGGSELELLDLVKTVARENDACLELAEPFAESPIVRARATELYVNWEQGGEMRELPPGDVLLPSSSVRPRVSQGASPWAYLLRKELSEL